MRLKDKAAIITGAGSGLGEAIARRFAAEGACLLVCDRNAQAVETLSDDLSARAPGVLAYEADVSDSAAVQEMTESCLKAFGKIDILINNAGISPKKDYLEYTEDDWDAVIDVNLKGEYLCARAVSEHMMARPLRPHRQPLLIRMAFGRFRGRNSLHVGESRRHRPHALARQDARAPTTSP